MESLNLTLFARDLFDLDRNYERIENIGRSLDERIARLARANKDRS